VRKHRIDDLMAGSYSPCDINVNLLLKNKQGLIRIILGSEPKGLLIANN
jgi:hypothetical protein